VLAPLPVRASAIFVAKVAAAASSLGLTVLALHCLAGLAWPGALMPKGAGFLVWLRFVAAYWIVIPASGAFLYCAMLGLQGAVALLPRAWFLRISSFLQLAAFAGFLSVIFLQPSFITAQALAAPENQRALAWLPDYWFMGLFNAISGAWPDPAMSRLAGHAVIGLAIAVLVALAAFVLSWLRTMRKIAEEPDILPGSRGGVRLPRFGRPPRTALVQFAIRTLARSRQHRMNLAFYLGVGFAMTAVTREPLLSSLVISALAIVGTRVAFSRPIDLRANWLFKVLPLEGGKLARITARRALWTIAVIPVWSCAAGYFVYASRASDAAKHLPILVLLSLTLAEIAMLGFQKIPFTCSYLPGKSKVHMAFLSTLQLAPIVFTKVMEGEQWVVSSRMTWLIAIAGFGGAIVALRKVSPPPPDIQFEEFPSDELISLNL
jgi:hypothetical protein